MLGKPFVFDQQQVKHLSSDPSDGWLITVFTGEDRQRDSRPSANGIGSLHLQALRVSRATCTLTAKWFPAAGFATSDKGDRGFMGSIHFSWSAWPVLLLARYKFEPPLGCTQADR